MIKIDAELQFLRKEPRFDKGRFIVLALMGALAASAGALRGETAPGTIDRTVLPLPRASRPTFTELDARTAKPPPRFDLKAPAGAPNVLVILIDDMGFGQPSTFGGPVHMPTLDRLAQGGLRYNYLSRLEAEVPAR